MREQPDRGQSARDEQQAQSSTGHSRGSIRLAERVVASRIRRAGRVVDSMPYPVPSASGAPLGLSGNATVPFVPLG